MADYDPFGNHESRPEEPTGEDIHPKRRHGCNQCASTCGVR